MRRWLHSACRLMLVLCSSATMQFDSSGWSEGAEPPTATSSAAADLFVQDIAGILQRHCLNCHGQLQQESGLRLDRAADVLRGGDRGPAVVAGQPSESWLYRAIDPHDDELQMPPEGEPLAEHELTAIRQWIEAGAAWPESIKQLAPAATAITDDDRAYWSFVPPRRVTPPAISDDAWSINDIDRFILHELRRTGQQPLPTAERTTLVRRVYLDLIGVPPTPDEVTRFVNDPDRRAYERLVDSLLDRPEYGQRWARHWLDLVRYAESDGFKADVYRPHAWHYRDYVVQSLNDDKPYDRFLQEQLAGDELFPDDRAARIATGYLRLWPLEDNQKDVQRQWTLILQDVTEVTAEVMMGIGIRCARCHDHKYDPIPQRDYYRMQAFFAPMLPRDDLELAADSEMPALRSWERQTAELRHAMHQVESSHVAGRKQTIRAYPPYLQAIYDTPASQWSPLDRQFAYLARPQVEKKATAELEFGDELRSSWDQLTAQLTEHERTRPVDRVAVMTVTDVGPVAPPTYLADNPHLPAVTPGYLSVLDPTDAVIAPIETSLETTGRRAALARWLTRPDHPLTSRVMVNRIWQQHFGQGIVGTPNDFGRQGERPTHPELLDWLAIRLIDDGWSLKQLHRLLVTSATYRQATLQSADDLPVALRTLRGWLPRRLDAEQIRDAMLQISGELRPYQPTAGPEGDPPVRSIQLPHVRNRPNEWLNTFDGPDMFNSCARRFVTTTPIQSLLVINSPWALDRAAALAQQIMQAETPAVDRMIAQAYQRTLCREPEPEEWRLAREFFQGGVPGDVERLTDFCHVLFCSNEFIYLD